MHRQKLLITLAIMTCLFVSTLCFAEIAAASQQSLINGAVADRRAMAGAILNHLGWMLVAGATIIATWDFFQKRDFSILMNLAFGYIIFFILARYFTH